MVSPPSMLTFLVITYNNNNTCSMASNDVSPTGKTKLLVARVLAIRPDWTKQKKKRTPS